MIVGLDFGTHQTKICIADYSDPQRPVHSFWKFETRKGTTYTLPSIVQINKDDTLTYGMIDEETVKITTITQNKEPQKPHLEEPIFDFKEKEPILRLPAKPKPQKMDWKDQLKALTTGTNNDLEQWHKACEEAKLDFDQDHRMWQSKYNKEYAKYEEKLATYNKFMSQYQEELEEYNGIVREPEPAIFRYFKQASFCNHIWDYIIDRDLLCIWYIAYILFDLEEKYGQDFSIQMGYPTDAKRLINRRNHAVRLLLSAYNLVENVFNGNKSQFLATKYTELINLTEIVHPTPDKKTEYGLLALPEAYANLVSATKQGKISQGISFVVDIGGGTTDISLFEVEKDYTPHIYGYSSMDVGINYIVEKVTGNRSMLKLNTLEELNNSLREKASYIFYQKLEDEIKQIIENIYKAFDDIALPRGALKDALKNRIIVYSGGGASYQELCNQVNSFTDVKKMDGSIWNGFVITDINETKTIANVFSTALGLSVARDNDDIVVSETKEIFDHLPKRKEYVEMMWGRRAEEMYGMMDE